MGGFEGSAPCPACGDYHWVRGFDAMVGAALAPGALQHPQIDHYWRVRDAQSSTRASILSSETRTRAFRACLCGAKLGIVLDVEHRAEGITLGRWRFLEIRHSEFVNQIDYAWHNRSAVLSSYPVEKRLAKLREQMEIMARDLEFPADGLVRVAGPTRCEDCEDVRERVHGTQLWSGDGFFGTKAAPSEQLFLGSMVAFDDAWLADDRARPPFFRARHPVGDELAILHRSRNWGCRCGAGRASFVTRFARRPGALELIDISIRVAATRADLVDIDFVCMLPDADGCTNRATLFDEFERIEAQLF